MNLHEMFARLLNVPYIQLEENTAPVVKFTRIDHSCRCKRVEQYNEYMNNTNHLS